MEDKIITDKTELTKTQKIGRIAVKCLIWFGILFSISFILTLVKMGGISLGAIPSAFFYIISLYICKKAGEGWDKYFHKKIEEKNKPEEFSTEVTERKDNNYEDIPENHTNDITIEEVPQEESEEVMQTENIAPLSYKDQKKAARTEYREKKKHLKEEHTNKANPKANKGFKIATFILSFVLLISVTANILLCVHVSELEIDIDKEKTLKEYYQDQHNDLEEYTNNLLSKHKQIKAELEDYEDIIYKYYNGIPLNKYEEHRAKIAAFWGAEENQ